MKRRLDIPQATIVIIVSILLAGVEVAWLTGSTLHSTAPHEVVADFVRDLLDKRYQQAHHYLDERLARHTGADDLQSFATELRSLAGAIRSIEGRAMWIDGLKAEAAADLRTSTAGTPFVRFALLREDGEWKISGLAKVDNTQFANRPESAGTLWITSLL